MDLDQYRQVISDAIQNEINARIFYEDVASRIKNDSLKEVFQKFATEERKHEKVLIHVLEKEKMDTSYFNYQKDFKVAQTISMPKVTAEMDLKNAIGLAMKNEEIAMNNYMALADNCDDEPLKAVFLDLASMEREHKFKMEQSFVDVAYPEVW